MISVLNKIGRDHNTCEDSYTLYEDEYLIQGVVADGCSRGINSAFASRMFCYLFDLFESLDLTDTDNIASVAEFAKITATGLRLSKEKLQTTLVIFRFDKITKQLKVRMIGDGVYYVNGQEFVVDQGEAVEYLGDHLNNPFHILHKNKVKTYYGVTNFKICSDGINRIKLPQLRDSKLVPKELLLAPIAHKKSLELKYNILHREGWQLDDDLTIISYDNLR